MKYRGSGCARAAIAIAASCLAGLTGFAHAAEIGRADYSMPLPSADRPSVEYLDALRQASGNDAESIDVGRGAVFFYSQFVNCPTGNAMFSNLNSTIFNNEIARDDFELGANARITQLAFWGANFDGASFCDPSNVQSFRIRIYEKIDGGACGCDDGPLVAERTIALGDTNALFECVGGGFGQDIYKHSVDLSGNPISLLSGQYILEIAATLIDPAGCAFLWSHAEASAGCIGHTIDATTGDCAQAAFFDTAFEFTAEFVANDECELCTPIFSVPFATTFDNSIATNSGGPEGSCNSSSAVGMDNDVWFCWTPDEDCEATLIVDYDVAAGYDGLTAVYTGADCSSLTEIACGDEPEPNVINFLAIAGTTYWIQVGDWGTFDGGGETTLVLDCGAPAPCPETLLVAAGGPDNPASGPSNLYRVNADTGAWALIGPIGFNGVTGLDFAPDGTLYGTANGDIVRGGGGGNSALLITIDPNTGAGTLVGEISNINDPGGFSRMPDIAFDHAGVLYGYSDNGGGGDALYTINTTTAAPTLVGFSGFLGGGNGIAFDNYGRLHHTPTDSNCLVLLDRSSGVGACVPGTELNVPPAVNSLDVCRTSNAIYGSQRSGPDSTIVILDQATGLPLRQVPTVPNIAALCFEELGDPNNCNGSVGILWDNGAPNFVDASGSLIDGPWVGVPPAQSADDFTLDDGAVINDIHWNTAEFNSEPIAWTGQVRIEIYNVAAGACLPETAPIASLTVPDDGGFVSRTYAGPFIILAGIDTYRFDVTGVNIPLPAGHYFLSVAPIAEPDAGGGSYWALSRSQSNGDVLVGCPAIRRGEAFIEPDWEPINADLNFQFTFCESCPEDLTGDGSVNADDLFQLLGAWGPCPGCPEDLTGDNQVNADDLFQLLGAWGPC